MLRTLSELVGTEEVGRTGSKHAPYSGGLDIFQSFSLLAANLVREDVLYTIAVEKKLPAILMPC